ncbi:hypothetical protein BI364_10940 [Acidihalobacter yilgarnensis]|uniref:Integral membrane protein n=1 Tax=Acidihalobacter yilgarnensis TaxID=2819280 RepID=A0A1D8IPN4_9GAMM|nr:Pr6Pr family membrane protein [Acidihalobacter yilgarnensis]AOU98406.1 hypothetical protein BI364_10940 [Acidihalobacter yilgarnensis]
MRVDDTIGGNTGIRIFTAIKVIALSGALVTWLALAAQLSLTTSFAHAQHRNFLYAVFLYSGYFTILTNTLCALIFTAQITPCRWAIFNCFFQTPRISTTAAISIAIVGAIYFALLRNEWHPTGWQLIVDIALHYVTPILFLVFWWLGTPAHALSWRDVGWLLAYPMLYMTYIFLRGTLTQNYPYPFIDMDKIGAVSALLNAAMILFLYLALAFLLISLNRSFNLSNTRS